MRNRPERSIPSNRQSATACLAAGNKFFAEQQVDDAIAKYREAIQHYPQYFQAHFNLGIALRKKGELDAAKAAYQQALAIEPQNAQAYYSLGNVLIDAKQVAAAIESYQKAIDLEPNFASAHFMLGYAAQSTGQIATAIASYERTVAIDPNRGDAFYNLGLAYLQQNQSDLAIANLEQAARLMPNDVEVGLSLGKEYKRINDFAAAQRSYARVVAIDPGNVEAHFQLGYIHHQADQLEAAIEEYQRAIELNPKYELAYSNLGAILRRQGQTEAAIALYEQALQVNPRNNSVLYNLGNAYFAQRQVDEAVACYRQVVAIKPDAIRAHQDLANILFKSDIVAARAAAEDYHRGCAHLDPIATLSNLVSTNLKSDYYDVALKYFLEIEAYVYGHLEQLNQEQLKTLYLGLLFFVPFLRDDAIANTKFFGTVAAAYLQKVVRPQVANVRQRLAASGIHAPSYATTPDSKSPLRIGFLSQNFKRHSVGWCSADFINHLRDFTPELFFYAAANLKEDDQTAKFRRVARRFHLFEGIQVEELLAPMLQQMWQDRLDVLIELDSSMSPLPAYVLHAAPAKVCMSWPGFEAPFISANHYFLCDRYTQPVDRDQYYLEQLFRVPHAHMAIAGFKSLAIDRTQERQKLGILPEQVVYLYAAPAQKSNPDSIAAQAQILAQVPGSVLLRKGAKDIETAQALYAQYCQQVGVSSDRIIFLSRTNTEEEHRIVYQIADVGLDSYPYNGGTHNLESLWFELPLVTLVGNQSFARMGYSFLSTVGLSAGIAHNWDEYIAKAVRLGQDPEFRRSVKEQLIQAKLPDRRSPLWDPAQFAYDLYNSLAHLSQKPILDNLAVSLDGAIADTPTPISNISESLFFKQLADEVVTTTNQLAKDPINRFLSDKLRHLRQQVANQWLTLPETQLASAYGSNLGKAHARLLSSGLRMLPLTFEGTEMLQNLYDRLAAEQALSDREQNQRQSNQPKVQANQVSDALRCLIVLTLFKYPHQLEIPDHKLLSLLTDSPQWLFGGLLQFCLDAPVMFRAIGEADRYGQYLANLVSFLKHQISQNLNSRHQHNQGNQAKLDRQKASQLFWQGVSRQFALNSYFVPAYFNNQNLRQPDQDRAAIVRISLQASGYQLDWQFAPRPRDRAKIRLGILKRNYDPYTETFSTLPIFEHLDRTKFEIFLYATEPSNHPFAQYCQQISDRLIKLPSDPKQQAVLIRQDDLDLMFIGTNITAAIDPIAVLALHRLARVQLTNFCSPVTTGSANMDYYLSGQLCESAPDANPAHENATNATITDSPHYTEKLIITAGVGYCFSYYAIPPRPSQTHPDRQSWGATDQSIVFVSGANFYKILPELRHTWAKILAATPDSILVLYPFGGNWRSQYPISTFVASLVEVLAEYGVKPKRLITLRNLPTRSDVKECLKLADIYLDSFPYAGSNSTIDPLEVGLPIVALAGACLRNKQGAALLQQLGFNQLVVNNEVEYIDLAVRLANEPSWRQELSQQIAQAMQPPPLFLDSKAYAGQIEPILIRLVAEWEAHQLNQQCNQPGDQRIDPQEKVVCQ
jgi:protein O-GlcNAc transferase